MPTKPSGHIRLQAALVLRDALAAELGVPLPIAMRQLANVENALGARRALDEGKYREALASLCQDDPTGLTQRDIDVRAACARAQLAPRYAQYLALLLFAHWLDAGATDATALLLRLNAFLAAHPPKGQAVTPFIEADLQFAAFWMATAAGKTHIVHACLALLEPRYRWDRILLVTPSEALTRQHAAKLRRLQQWNVFAYPFDGEAAALGRLPPDTVIVLDINKLAEEKKGDGVTVPTAVFQDGRNLVFVDEGHKGQRSEQSAWKRLQQDLAGVAAPQMQHRGLLIEFSATFGQVAEAEHAFDRYAKSVVFDYAYNRFHADLYGKDFWHIQLAGRADIDKLAQQQTLTAALIAFWRQTTAYHSNACRETRAAGWETAAPLWVLLGLSVIGGGAKSDAEQTTDVVDVLIFLNTILSRPAQLTAWVREALTGAAGGAGLLPPEAQAALAGVTAETLTPRLLADVFLWQAGDRPVLRLLKAASGELGLGLLRGDEIHYFGVVNVGDANGLKKALEKAGLAVDEDALSPSLFVGLERGSGVNLLIGSRRFAEGWDNYRASSLTLLRLGQGEGALIIQMFGRVVRFAGRNGDGKRQEQPSPDFKPLQTAYVYGLRSDYLNTFLNSLYANGVAETQQIECPTRCSLPTDTPLLAVRTIAPTIDQFRVELKGDGWLAGVKQAMLSLTAAVTTTGVNRQGLSITEGVAGEDITARFKAVLPLLDRDALYREMVEFKRLMGWWNLSFDWAAIDAALASDRYRIEGLSAVADVRNEADLLRCQRIAATLTRQLFEQTYRRQENRQSRYELIDAAQSGVPEAYYKVIFHAAAG